MTSDGETLADFVRSADPDRYMTSLFAPAKKRPLLWALYAFNIETGRIADLVSDPLVGQIRLQWWREGLEGLAAGAPARRHNVLEALAPLLSTGRLDAATLGHLLDAREAELAATPFVTMAELEAYAAATGGALMALAAALLDPAADPAGAIISGTAHAITGVLRNLPHHLTQGRLLLPRETLENAGLCAEDLWAGQNLDRLAGALRPLYDRAQTLLGQVSRPTRAVRPALLPLALARSDLRALKACGFNAFSPALRRERPGRLLRLTWAGLTGHL